jgi:hypothetical protein
MCDEMRCPVRTLSFLGEGDKPEEEQHVGKKPCSKTRSVWPDPVWPDRLSMELRAVCLNASASSGSTPA